jgi:hypothetical protein
MDMSSKKAPKSPNYQPLVDTANKQSQQAYDTSQQQQQWAKDTYAQNKEVSDKVIDSNLSTMDAQSKNAAADRARYDSTFIPLQNEYIQKAQDYASPGRMEVEAGKAEADVASQFAAARQSAQDRLESYGVDPSSTRAGALDLGTRVAQAAAQSSAGNQARTQTEATGNQMLMNAIGLGQNLPGQATTEYSSAGQAGNQAANTGLATTASGAQTMGTGTQWQQLGTQGLGTAADLMHTGYSDQLSGWKENQNASSGWGSALGMVAGTAAKMIPGFALAEGGAIPEPGMGGTGGFGGQPTAAAPGTAMAPSSGAQMQPAMPQPAAGPVPTSASPSGGQVTDDVRAQAGAIPIQLNAGEFIMPKDVTQWLGEKGMQNMVMKARKQMSSQNQRPAQPQVGPAPPQPGQPPMQPGQPQTGQPGAIPMMGVR